jgi:hypothetical protein
MAERLQRRQGDRCAPLPPTGEAWLHEIFPFHERAL